MRAIAYTRPGVGMIDIPEPQIETLTQIKIKMSYASLRGSDLHIFDGDFDYLLPQNNDPIPIGHEGSGVITELGPEATKKGLKVGDEVTFYFNAYCGTCYWCRSGREQFCGDVYVVQTYMSDYIVMEEQQVFKLPENPDMVAAALIEPVSICLRGIDMMAPRPGETMAVFGGGGIGQITARIGHLAGCAQLTLFEPVEAKREIASKWGIPHTFDPIAEDAYERAMEITNGRGFDYVVECSGAQSAVDTSMKIVSRGGTVELMATYKEESELRLPIHKAFLDEITVITGVMQSPYILPRCVELYERLGLRDLATVYQPDDYLKGIEEQRSGDTIKTVFDFTS